MVEQGAWPAEAIALYDLSVPPERAAKQLELKAGERLIIIQQVDKNWFKGHAKNHPQKTGLFPHSYVAVQKNKPKVPELGGQNEANKESKEQTLEAQFHVRVMESYKGDPASHGLEVKKDEVLQVISDAHKKWFYCRIGTREGYVPRKVVIECTKDEKEVQASPRKEKLAVEKPFTFSSSSSSSLCKVSDAFHGDTALHQLSVKSGQEVKVVKAYDNGWSFVENVQGEKGYVPSNYIISCEKENQTSSSKHKPQKCVSKHCKGHTHTDASSICLECANYQTFYHQLHSDTLPDAALPWTASWEAKQTEQCMMYNLLGQIVSE